MFRKVRIQKVEGKAGETFPTGTVREGWEKEVPRVGERYALYQDNGKVYRTGMVRKAMPDGFVTDFSMYRMEIIEEIRYDAPPTGTPD